MWRLRCLSLARRMSRNDDAGAAVAADLRAGAGAGARRCTAVAAGTAADGHGELTEVGFLGCDAPVLPRTGAFFCAHVLGSTRNAKNTEGSGCRGSCSPPRLSLE